MAGDSRMFNSIKSNDGDGVQSIIFGDNSKARSRGLVKLLYLMI
jgi:hypothetical protein